MRKLIYGMAVAILLTSSAASAQSITGADDLCESLENRFGPFDYRKRETQYSHELWLVNSTHFTPSIENGIKGRSGSLANELDYTLRAFPNHIRALASLDRLSLRNKNLIVLPGSRFPVECYFERAVRFAPDDGEARAAYAGYLFSRGKTDAALKMYDAAVRLNPEDPVINYNVGLMYMKTKNYDKASFHGRKAYQLGFPLPGLKNQLMAVGKWESEASTPVPAPAPAKE